MRSASNTSSSAVYIGALFAIGVSSLLWQVAMARAVMAALHGNELTLGLIMGSWLLLMGVATALVTWVAALRRAASRLLGPLLLLLPVGLLLSLSCQGPVLPAFSAAGEVIGPGRALLSALLCLLPSCLLLGGSFGLAALQPAGSAAGWAARLFAWESLGTVAAGLLFHVWLAPRSLAALGFIAGLAPWLAGLVVARRQSTRRQTWSTSLLGAAALLYFLLIGLAPEGATWTTRPRLRGYHWLEQRNSPHAALGVLQRGDQLLFSVNGQTAFTNQDQQQAAMLLHPALLVHPTPRDVLMIGGGLGGGLAAVLQHPVRRVDYVELDRALVELARKWSGPALQAVLDDPRVSLCIGDGRHVVRERAGRYDVILLALPGPSSALLNRFYTSEFFAQARRALRPGGLLAVTLEGSESYLDEQLALVHTSVYRALQQSLGRVSPLPGGTALLLARRGAALDTRFEMLAERLRQRRVSSPFFGETELMDRVLPFKQALYRKRLDEVRPLRNTDLFPAVYFHALVQWLTLSSPRAAGSLAAVARFLEGRGAWVALAAVLLSMLATSWRRGRARGGAGLGLAIVGSVGLATELCLLLAAQIARGVIYHEMGALLTAFMAGLAGGAGAGRRLVSRWPRRALELAVASCGLVALAVMLTLPLVLAWPAGALALLLAQMLLLGAAVGACYAPAAGELAARQGTAAAAHAYAWDLAGAAAGALLTSTLALPVLGLPGCCLLCAALCLGTALGLLRHPLSSR